MNYLNLKLELTTKSLTSLHEALSGPYSLIIRDATFIRFKRSVEIFWRLMEDYLFVHEGFVCESPKSCMRMAFKIGLMDEEETVKSLEMIDLRLKSEHACQEEDLEKIYRQVGDYWKLMDEVCRRVVERVESGFPVSPAEK
jgi:hypothetical protein